MIREIYSDQSMHTMIKEIGSEFWLDQEPVSLNHDRNGVFVMSGRTAIDLIIQEILRTSPVRVVYMPAYSCDSMIMPFVQRGIKVELYDMSFDGQLHYHIDFAKKIDVFYVNNYFGYENTIKKDIIDYYRANGAIILYDRTHSFLMDDVSIDANYSFASIRKWVGVVCGAEVKGVEADGFETCPYIGIKEEAMRVKGAYMHGDNIDKSIYLKLFAEFGHHLTEDYCNYKMDDLSYSLYQSTDWAGVRRRRITNAKYLHDNLGNYCFLGKITDGTCPLFVPIFLPTEEWRNKVRQKLVAQNIFCPIHWPKNQLVTSKMKVNHVFDTELSLVCDQRYGITDMQRIIEILQS